MARKPNKYIEFHNRQQQEVNELPLFFAFNAEQMQEICNTVGTDVEHAKDILVSIGIGGGMCRKSDKEFIDATFDRHAKEREIFLKDLDNFRDGISYELGNHEYVVSMDYEPAIYALGFSPNELTEAQKEIVIEEGNRQCKWQNDNDCLCIMKSIRDNMCKHNTRLTEICHEKNVLSDLGILTDYTYDSLGTCDNNYLRNSDRRLDAANVIVRYFSELIENGSCFLHPILTMYDFDDKEAFNRLIDFTLNHGVEMEVPPYNYRKILVSTDESVKLGIEDFAAHIEFINCITDEKKGFGAAGKLFNLCEKRFDTYNRAIDLLSSDSSLPFEVKHREVSYYDNRIVALSSVYKMLGEYINSIRDGNTEMLDIEFDEALNFVCENSHCYFSCNRNKPDMLENLVDRLIANPMDQFELNIAPAIIDFVVDTKGIIDRNSKDVILKEKLIPKLVDIER